MSDRVQIICPACEAKLTLRTTSDQAANRKVSCPKCASTFAAKVEMIRTDDSENGAELTSKPPKSAVKRKPALAAEKHADELDDEDDLPELPRAPSPRKKKPAGRGGGEEPPVLTQKKHRKKTKPRTKRSLGMAAALWTLGGVCGALVGSGVWGLAAYLTGWQVGFLSILIGTTIGIGVRLGAAECEGWMPATTAVLLTLVTVFLSKLALNYTLFYDGMGFDRGGTTGAMSQEELVAEFGKEVVAPEFQKQGKPILHPRADHVDFRADSAKGVYDPAFWREAESRWNALSPQEQAAYKQNLDDRARGVDRQSLIQRVAETEVKPAFEQANKPVYLTEADLTAGNGLTLYQPEVLQEAEERFNAKTPAERTALIASIHGEQAVAEQAAQGMMLSFVLIYTLLGFLWPGNIICLILACLSAYQIGNYDGITT